MVSAVFAAAGRKKYTVNLLVPKQDSAAINAGNLQYAFAKNLTFFIKLDGNQILVQRTG